MAARGVRMRLRTQVRRAGSCARLAPAAVGGRSPAGACGCPMGRALWPERPAAHPCGPCGATVASQGPSTGRRFTTTLPPAGLGEWSPLQRAPPEPAAGVGVAGEAGECEGQAPGPPDAPAAAKGGPLTAWVAPGAEVYANPICSQLDQLLLKCDDVESVLALLVTHRGVFFVHNLVTAIQTLASLVGDPEVRDFLTLNKLLRDPRYDLLIRDLLRFVPKLDYLAMTNIACSLCQLDHKHYLLLSRMLLPLLRQPSPDVATMLRCVQAYSSVGYHAEHQFYAHCAEVIADVAQSLEPREVALACNLFGGAVRYQPRLFEAAERELVGRDLLETALTPHEVGVVAHAFAAHARFRHDGLLERVGSVLERRAQHMEVADIALCLAALRRTGLRLDGAIRAGLVACAGPLQRAWLLRRRADGVRAADVAALLECVAYFGVCDEELTGPALDYLDCRVDEVGEDAAVRVVYAMCLTGGVSTHSRLLLYLFRKIGASTGWEAHKLFVFHLWICQHLQFPWLDARLKRRCVEDGLRAWCLHRRGYGSPFPDDVREVAAELAALGVAARAFVPVPGTPYEVDVAVGSRKDALLVASEVARNTLEPVGGVLLQLHHLRARGWRCAVVPRRLWRDLGVGPGGQDARQAYLRALLDSLAARGQAATDPSV